MATVTLLASVWNTTAGAKTVTATPAVGDLIVIIAAHSGVSGNEAGDNQGAGTYTEVEARVKNSSADDIRVYVRDELIASATSTIFGSTPGTTTGGGVMVLKVTGMSRVGAAAVRQAGGQANVASSTAPIVTLGSAMLTSNPVIGAVFNGANPAGLTPPALMTELADVGYGTPPNGLEVCAANSGVTSTFRQWGNTTITYATVLLELDTSAGGTTFNQGVGGSLGPSGSLPRSIGKRIRGSAMSLVGVASGSGGLHFTVIRAPQDAVSRPERCGCRTSYDTASHSPSRRRKSGSGGGRTCGICGGGCGACWRHGSEVAHGLRTIEPRRDPGGWERGTTMAWPACGW